MSHKPVTKRMPHIRIVRRYVSGHPSHTNYGYASESHAYIKLAGATINDRYPKPGWRDVANHRAWMSAHTKRTKQKLLNRLARFLKFVDKGLA